MSYVFQVKGLISSLIFDNSFLSNWGKLLAFQVALVVKNPHASAGDMRDAGLIPGQEDLLEEGMANPLQYSCLENLMDRGAWRATVHGVTKSRT